MLIGTRVRVSSVARISLAENDDEMEWLFGALNAQKEINELHGNHYGLIIIIFGAANFLLIWYGIFDSNMINKFMVTNQKCILHFTTHVINVISD